MSQIVKGFSKTMKATTDLSAKQYFIVKVDTANDESVVLAAAGTDPILGVLENKPKAGQAASVQILGTTKVYAGGAVNPGDRVTSDGNGKAVATTSNKDVGVGIALQVAASGDVFEIFLTGSNKQSF